jgi:bacteriorhodopsin
MAVFSRANDALSTNAPAGSEALSTNGSNWLWAATAIYALSFVVFYATSFRARSGEKIFHFIFTIALLVGTIVYFAQAGDLGFDVVYVVNSKPDDMWTRQVFWAKYVHWVVEFPAVILSLGLISGISWATIFFNVFLSWTWVISYLVSAYTTSQYKWGFFAFGTIAWIILAYNTIAGGLEGARRVGVSRDYLLLAGWTNLLWLLYPVAFGLSDGGNTIGVTPGAIFFGVLDVLLAPVIAFAFLGLGARWDYNKLNLAFTRYGRVSVGGEFPEKHHEPAHAPAPAHAGVTTGEAPTQNV